MFLRPFSCSLWQAEEGSPQSSPSHYRYLSSSPPSRRYAGQIPIHRVTRDAQPLSQSQLLQYQHLVANICTNPLPGNPTANPTQLQLVPNAPPPAFLGRNESGEDRVVPELGPQSVSVSTTTYQSVVPSYRLGIAPICLLPRLALPSATDIPKTPTRNASCPNFFFPGEPGSSRGTKRKATNSNGGTPLNKALKSPTVPEHIQRQLSLLASQKNIVPRAGSLETGSRTHSGVNGRNLAALNLAVTSENPSTSSTS